MVGVRSFPQKKQRIYSSGVAFAMKVSSMRFLMTISNQGEYNRYNEWAHKWLTAGRTSARLLEISATVIEGVAMN